MERKEGLECAEEGEDEEVEEEVEVEVEELTYL